MFTDKKKLNRSSSYVAGFMMLFSGCGGDPQSDVEIHTRQASLGAPASYIVVLNAGATPNVVAQQHGAAPEFVFRHALNGFSAHLAPQAVAALRNDSRIAYIEADQAVYANAQTVPTGINRTDADLSSTAAIDGVDNRVNVGVAVIDTGVQLNHPDLNVQSGITVIKGTKSATDDNGHGTHVAGTIGALDNGVGVVGMAPGATIWAVKVLNKQGSGTTAGVIKGIDWVTANAAAKGIRVANMSLGGGASQALDEAVRNSINSAGVVYAVAAGNESRDASLGSPARVAEAITVSSLADSDGQSGGVGAAISKTFSSGQTHIYNDDVFANVLAQGSTTVRAYSNYGAVVDIIAPGTNIYSTYPGSSYATLTGTSMACPHVAGAAALLRANQPGLTPQQVRDAIVNAGTYDYSYKTSGDDPDGIQEPLLNVSNF